MKIGIFDPYLDTLGGGEKYMLTAASVLSQKHDVFVFWDENILKEASDKFNINLSRVKTVDNIFSEKVSFPKRLINTRKYDAIFYLSNGSLPIVSCKLYVHFQFPVEWVNADKIIVKQKVRRVKKFICNSNFTKEFIDKKFNVNSLVVYPPVYFNNQMPKVDYKKKKNFILNVGRLSKNKEGEYFKKQDVLIEAFKKMINNGLSNWELVLVTSLIEKDKHLLTELKEKAKGFPIKIYENIDFEVLGNLYKESKIYWHASGFGENLYKNPEKAEHFGITTVESMANGLVPVVINAGGQKEIVTDGENGFLWKTEDELIKKTKEIIENQDLFLNLSKKAIKSGRDFSADRFCEKINEIFNE